MPLEELVASRFPGVWLSRNSDGSLAVRIRGTTTFVGSKDPLFILDGTPILPGPNGGLAGLVPSDIESIEVVKDVAGMAMYGIQGANGIIIIKTKRPLQ